MKKIVALILAALMLAACFAGCGAAGEAENTNKLEAVKAAGKLTMATSPDFPPFESLDPDGNVFGIEVEIMELICKEICLIPRLRNISRPSMMTLASATGASAPNSSTPNWENSRNLPDSGFS